MTSVVDPGIQLSTDTPGTLAVRGELNFDTAAGAFQAIEVALGDGGVTRLDLAGVTRSDSAGLACVLAVVAAASRRGRRLQVMHMPTGMQALAKVCEVDRLIA